MLRPTRWWWGMMCVATLACGDEGPLEGPTVRAVARDLEFVLPGVRDLGPAFNREGSVVEEAAGSASLSDGTTSEQNLVPFFTSKYLTAGFNKSVLSWRFGFTGYGTGYTIVPRGVVRKADGTEHMSGIGGGVSYDFALPLAMKGDWSEVADVGRECGHYANFDASFSARVVLAGIAWLPSMQVTERLSTISHQPGCPPPGGGGSTVTSTASGLKICYYEIHTDIDGNVVEVLPLGCYPIAMS